MITPDADALLAHETFHVFCHRRHPQWAADETAALLYPVEDVEILTLRRLEAAALRRAVVDRSADSVATAMALRRERMELLPDDSARYERDLERWEGLAHFVEGKVAGQTRCIDTLGPDLPPDNIRAAAYATGEAMAVLLDRFAPGWVDRLESDDALDLDDLLSDAVVAHYPPAPITEYAAATESARQSIAAMISERRAQREAFLSRKGTVVLTASEAKPFTIAGFDPMNVTHLGAGEVLHTRWLKLHVDGTDLEVLDSEALTESAGSHPLFDGVARVTLTGWNNAG